jgi:chromosome segregation ATPase
MEWLNMTWISANWVPLVVALVLGFILGWLLTGLAPRRKNTAYEAQISDLESRSRKSERELTDVRKERDGLKSSVAAGENSLNDVRGQLSAAQADLQKLGEEKSAFEADVQSRNIEVADLKMQLALLQDQFEKTKGGAAAEAESLRATLQSRADELSALTAERDSLSAEVAAVKSSAEQAMQSISAKDAALNESYQRVVNLQRVLEDRDAALAAVQSELSTLRTDVASLNNIKAELEDRLQKARGDVAGEMAVLTSTMIKMKEDQLTMANVRIAELMNELNANKVSQAVG